MSQASKINAIEICGVKVDIIQIPEVIKIMEQWINNDEQGNYISVTNAHSIAINKKEPAFGKAINMSSLSVPDGASLVLLARMYGHRLHKRVYGPDLMLEFLKRAEEKGYSNFFYGYNPDNLTLLIKNLKNRFPRLKISGMHASIFGRHTDEENKKVVDMICAAVPDVLWVGLGCPRQELWMFEHKDKLNIPVTVGVGAAFDFLAGIKPQAPYWMRDRGMEWFFRLMCEPRRLWKRYLVDQGQFMFYATAEIIKRKFSRRQKDHV